MNNLKSSKTVKTILLIMAAAFISNSSFAVKSPLNRKWQDKKKEMMFKGIAKEMQSHEDLTLPEIQERLAKKVKKSAKLVNKIKKDAVSQEKLDAMLQNIANIESKEMLQQQEELLLEDMASADNYLFIIERLFYQELNEKLIVGLSVGTLGIINFAMLGIDIVTFIPMLIASITSGC